ncbi:MAG: acyl-CoA dehydrogenase, partial [Alphaproteobacteria bacterium]|nr:acyl-CoA dehydrogenase [Alphaproteobacteria bacterium]
MDFTYSEKVNELRRRVQAFMDEHVYPNEATYHEQMERAADRWQPVPIIEELKPQARAPAFRNLYLPQSHHGAGLTILPYA